ncbi:MAG: hypothetical protein AABY26_03260 [Nanoarchaeota archaeon]
MNKKGELKASNSSSELIKNPLLKESNKIIILEIQADMKANSGKVITVFYLHSKHMLENNYEVSWGYGKLYPFEMLKEVTAYVQSTVKMECRLLLEGKIIFLSCGFFKSNFPETTRSRPDFKTLSQELLKGKQLTIWLTPGEEPEIVTIYIVPTIHIQRGKPIYFVVGEDGTGKYTSGGFAEKLKNTDSLVKELTSNLLRKKMVHAVPNSRQTPVTGANVKVPFLKRA